MNNHQSHPDIFYEQQSSRSPGAHRHQQQTLHRQPSRHFDVYGQMPPPIYAQEDQASRYEPNRYGMNNSTAMQGGGSWYDMTTPQTWNPSAFGGGNSLSPFGATGRMKSITRGRAPLPTTWLDQQHPMAPIGQFSGLGSSPLNGSTLRAETFSSDPDEELIPTAIVIKNIPFAVKKEQLSDLMTQLNLPLPYAFNYHFDSGVFRGLAFANFTSAEETATVIEHLNHFELQGRKLRVEYKKMLPLQERERIEREKRERRGQLEEQHRPLASTQLNNHPSMSSLSSHLPATTPSPVSTHNVKFDLNDRQTLTFYNEMLLFREDRSRDTLIFPSTLTSQQRRTVHVLAHTIGLAHSSHGSGEQRQVHVFRPFPGHNTDQTSPPMSLFPTLNHNESSRRGLNRAATIDFNEARANNDGGIYNNTLRAQQSSGFLGIPDSPNGFGIPQNLRAAKSFADLRSYTPSPAPSTASFPAALQSNIARFQDIGPGSAASTTPTLTATGSVSAIGQHRGDEGLLVNGLGGMSLGGSNFGPNSGSPGRLRPIFSWDESTRPQQSATGPIGSNRHAYSANNLNNAYDDGSRDRNGGGAGTIRQPRGPLGAERSSGFSRGRSNGHGHQSRGSDELRQPSSVAIPVE